MALINPNMDEVVSVEPGNYSLRVVGSEVKASKKNSAALYVQWDCMIFGAEDDRVNGKKLIHRTMINGKGAGMFKSFFKSLTNEDWPEEGIDDFDTEQLHDREFAAVVVMGTDQNGNQTDFPEIKSTSPLAA